MQKVIRPSLSEQDILIKNNLRVLKKLSHQCIRGLDYKSIFAPIRQNGKSHTQDILGNNCNLSIPENFRTIQNCFTHYFSVTRRSCGLFISSRSQDILLYMKNTPDCSHNKRSLVHTATCIPPNKKGSNSNKCLLEVGTEQEKCWTPQEQTLRPWSQRLSLLDSKNE